VRPGDLAVVACDLGNRGRVYPQPIAAADSFEVPNDTLVVVLEVGHSDAGSYFGEVRILLPEGRTGWIPTVHLRPV
jgi:hypothetical protein